MKIETKNAAEVVKEAFWIAYQACGGPLGMGVFQARSGATKEDVWNNVQNAGDYSGCFRKQEANDAYGDYVFGRMMKLGLKWDESSVTCRDEAPRHDYQAWCNKYPTYQSLVEAAIKNIEYS